jgi:hypothetical protein
VPSTVAITAGMPYSRATIDVCIDGVLAKQEQLKGKPAPDTFLAAARELGVVPTQAAVFEDAPAGVEAGRSGGFGWVVGVDRTRQRGALLRHGADVVVDDLADLLEVKDSRMIFLDEPTTGLDPRSRCAMWQIIRDLVAQRTGREARSGYVAVEPDCCSIRNPG